MKNFTLWTIRVVFLICLWFPGHGVAQNTDPPIAEIMQRVAARQDEARDLRSSFLYRQDVRVRFHRSNGKLAREEERTYHVIPDPQTSRKNLVRFQGRYQKDGRFIGYSTPGYTYKDPDIDGELIDDLTNDLIDERESRDGFACDLFPLTGKSQSAYEFKLQGKENYRGREVYKIRFRPRKNEKQEDKNALWKGELLVDTVEYQPVTITTQLATGIPILVRTLLGTNLKGLGFKLDYEKVFDGIWFPVRYGGEFALNAVFFYKRRISIGLHSYDFQRADVSTRIEYHPQQEKIGN